MCKKCRDGQWVETSDPDSPSFIYRGRIAGDVLDDSWGTWVAMVGSTIIGERYETIKAAKKAVEKAVRK